MNRLTRYIVFKVYIADINHETFVIFKASSLARNFPAIARAQKKYKYNAKFYVFEQIFEQN